jgi:hypothetical protein
LELEVLSSVPNHDIESILSDLGVHYDTRGSKQNFKKIRGITAIDEGGSSDITFSSLYTKLGSYSISKSYVGIILYDKSLQPNLSPKADQLLVFIDNLINRYSHRGSYTRTKVQ